MKGYVLQGKGDAAWQEVPVPEIGPYDALVRPTAVATCTTDVHAIATLAFPNALNKVIGPRAPSAAKRSTTRPTARTCPRTPRSAARSPSW